MAINILLNGVSTDVTEDGSLPLIFALRNSLGLKGTRFGCGGEDCGACTVLVDGELKYSCTATLGDVAGRRVDTVEGLAGQRAELLKAAFVAERAGQCGYCLSGIVMTAYSLLSGPQRPTHDEVKTSLSRHLCRCGSHASILRAVEKAIGSVWSGTVDG